MSNKPHQIANPIQENAARFPDDLFIITEAQRISFAHFAELVQEKARKLIGEGYGFGSILPFQADICLESLVTIGACLALGVVACPMRQEDFEARRGNLSQLVLSSYSPFDLRSFATLVQTSGSSGKPKAALHSLGNHYFSALGSATNIPLAHGDRWLLNLPLYHVSGLGVFFRCLFSASTLVIGKGDVAEIMAQFHITHLSLVAKQLQDLLYGFNRIDNFSKVVNSVPISVHVRHILLGGSVIPSRLIQEAKAQGLPIHLSYGMTEMASQIATTPSGASLDALLNAAGTVLPHREVRIAADGEVWVRGATRFEGYLQEDMLTSPFDADGWFATNDLGEWTETGALKILGRKDNMFISGGENIQPEEIERILLQYEGISQAVVVPVADETWGFRPVAFLDAPFLVAPFLENDRNEEALRQFLTERLPKFKIPDHFLPMPSLPDSGIKISRKALMAHV